MNVQGFTLSSGWRCRVHMGAFCQLQGRRSSRLAHKGAVESILWASRVPSFPWRRPWGAPREIQESQDVSKKIPRCRKDGPRGPKKRDKRSRRRQKCSDRVLEKYLKTFGISLRIAPGRSWDPHSGSQVSTFVVVQGTLARGRNVQGFHSATGAT